MRCEKCGMPVLIRSGPPTCFNGHTQRSFFLQSLTNLNSMNEEREKRGRFVKLPNQLCRECGGAFARTGYNHKYCKRCSKKVVKARTLERRTESKRVKVERYVPAPKTAA